MLRAIALHCNRIGVHFWYMCYSRGSVVLLLVAFSRCFFKYLHFVLIFATLLWFFQRENLGAFVVSHYISNQNQLFFFKIKTKLAKSKTKWRYLKKHQENATRYRGSLHATGLEGKKPDVSCFWRKTYINHKLAATTLNYFLIAFWSCINNLI